MARRMTPEALRLFNKCKGSVQKLFEEADRQCQRDPPNRALVNSAFKTAVDEIKKQIQDAFSAKT